MFLCALYGLAWSEVSASNLVMIDGCGKLFEGLGEVDVMVFFIYFVIYCVGVVCVLYMYMSRASVLCCVELFELAMCY